jgi:hypothetical protein
MILYDIKMGELRDVNGYRANNQDLIPERTGFFYHHLQTSSETHPASYLLKLLPKE